MQLSEKNASDKALFDAALDGRLPNELIQRLCELINNEYLLKGLEKNYAPNSYGVELESLVDAVNRPRIQRIG